LQATIIGSGSPVFNEKRASSSYYISNGKTNILIDMGNGTQRNLNRLNIDERDLDALLITHHHLDHNEELAPIFIHALLGRQPFKIYGPPNTSNFIDGNVKLYEEDINYRLGKTGRSIKDRESDFTAKDLLGKDSFMIGDIKVTTCKVNHTIYTLAYKFEYGGKSIVITGDLTYTKEIGAFAQNADYMIMDAGGMIMSSGSKFERQKMRAERRKGKQPDGVRNRNSGQREIAHVNLEESSQMAKEANVKTIVYSHFTDGNINKKASVTEIRKNYKGNIIFGEDLMTLQKKFIYK
jgi:ribonuclease BN (tRNA processing enzyme)